MNRNEEYRALLSELEELPEQLNETVQRALLRRESSRKRRRRFAVPAAGMAACFAVFVLLVNLSVPFARACGSIPLVRDLAKAVAWSPSLSAAVENAYVQPIGQSQTVNGITATIEYVIVDQKQLNIFFTLNSDAYENLSAELPEFSNRQGCSVTGADFRQPPGTLLHYTMDYQDRDVPDSLTMTFGVTTWVEPNYTEMTPPPERSVEDDMLDPPEEPEQEILAEFTFALHFDPEFTAKGESIPVNRDFCLDGQSLRITEVEIYPTHVRVNVSAADEENTAWLKDLEFYLENERGERFEPISNGISASGEEDTPMMISYRLESPYFADSRHLTLHITGAMWLDRDMERVRIDLLEGRAERLPEGVSLHRAEKRDGGWLLTFRVKEEENHHYQIFSTEYYDGEGTRWDSNLSAFTTGEDGYSQEELPLQGFHGDTVWLCPNYSRTTVEEIPVTIPIK